MLVFKDTTFCSDIDCAHFDDCKTAGNATNLKGKDKSIFPVAYASFKAICQDYEKRRKNNDRRRESKSD